MTLHVATSLDDVCTVVHRDPAAQLLAGGTDFMVEVNFGKRRADSVVAIDRVPELRGWEQIDDEIVLGAGLTYTEMEAPELAALVPALAQAARTVGSPQIRNVGTLGGNLATASPAGDTIPVLAALDARVTVASVRGQRRLALDQLITGVKQTSLARDEVIVSATVPVVSGAQEFCKVGVRNAMVISVSSVALVLDREARAVRVGLGSVTPVPVRATDAERWVSDRVDWDAHAPPETGLLGEFGERVAAASRPVDDHRSTADYRRHSIAVMARRALGRAVTRRPEQS